MKRSHANINPDKIELVKHDKAVQCNILSESIQPAFHTNIGKDHILTLSVPADHSSVEFISWKPTLNGNLEPWSQRTLKLDLSQFKELINIISKLKDSVQLLKSKTEDFKTEFHLGKLLYCGVKSNVWCVSLRYKFKNCQTNSLQYGNPGLGLKLAEFDSLCTTIPQLIEILNLNEIQSCTQKHADYNSMVQCQTCNPLGCVYPVTNPQF